ncbi:hypothetical protein BRADI_1g60340v3 [Brachypodium distachyon]|uniref:Protein kinase domain-containing protein n=1 Tax=Brachypodium distachyon TaxID=15368 RepID=A0A0Q3JV73_BRADI|nr:hypothetical protein BRADI_1g60340v3 [Brachypodium distachyon]
MDWIEQVNICDLIPPKNLPTPAPFSVISSTKGSCKRFPQDYDAGPMKIKLICNFGGRFLPRPSDGELRYIGGDRHLIKIRRDISWQELICKTTKLIRRAHTIKYHLPGEQVSMLISITSDDDLRHMVDECTVLERTKEMVTMYLFSGKDDERHVHFVVQSSSDVEKEAQFIALINGLVRPGNELRTQRMDRSSVQDLDQLMPGLSLLGLPTARTEEASMYIKSKPSQSITVPLKTASGQSEKRVANQDYRAQGNEGNMISAATNASKAYLGASVPCETTLRQQQGGGLSVSRHQQQSVTESSGKSHQATGAQETRSSPRNQLPTPSDNSSVKKTQPSDSNNRNPMPHTSPPVHFKKPASLSRGPQKTVNQQGSSDENKLKSRTHGTQEEDMFHSAEHPARKNSKVEICEPNHESGTPGCNLHYVEKSVVTNSILKQQPAVPCVFTALDTAINLQPNILARASSERIQERPSSPRPDENAPKITRFRSVGTDGVNPQTGIPSQEEDKDNNTSLPISEPEVLDTKGSEPRPANAVLVRDLISNVQIISNEDLEDLREMGSGAFGTVFHGKWRGTDVAIKRIKNSCFSHPSSQADKLITEFWREAAIISKLHHPNILALYGIVKNGPGGTLGTVTEFMVNGSLKKVLSRKDKYLDWRKRILVAMDAAIGMEYLHSKDIVHFDLKCDNLLVNIKDPSRPICKDNCLQIREGHNREITTTGCRFWFIKDETSHPCFWWNERNSSMDGSRIADNERH